MKFQVNEGPLDRLIRVLVGVVMLSVAAGTTGPLFFVALVVVFIGLVTGLTGFFLPYVLFGINTLPKGAQHHQKGGA